MILLMGVLSKCRYAIEDNYSYIYNKLPGMISWNVDHTLELICIDHRFVYDVDEMEIFLFHQIC